MEFLALFTFIILMITIISLLNEKIFKISNDIALLLFSFIICAGAQLICKVFSINILNGIIEQLSSFKMEYYLLDCALCFMLFAGAGKVHFGKFTTNLKTITLLSFLTTAISAFLYGGLFWIVSNLIGWNINIWICILLGCIVSPTDPIAATGIMNKLGLSKNVTTVIESESLFNDGMGVALFAFVKSIVCNIGQENFLILMLREIGGAVIVATVITFLLFSIIKKSKEPINHIFISILAVSSIYLICEKLGFSGVIASVICGMAFSYGMEKIDRFREVVDDKDMYNNFWDYADSILNSVLFVLIGISALRIPISEDILFILITAVIVVIVSRAVGVALPSIIIRNNTTPGGYNLFEFVLLMTWSALKGGLTLALVLSTKEFLPEGIYTILVDAAYITIFFTVIVQGLTTKKMYKMIERHKSIRIRKEGESR